MSDEKTKPIINMDEVKRRGKKVVNALCSWVKNVPPGLAKYAGDLSGIFKKAEDNPASEMMARAGLRLAKEQHNLDSIARKAGESMSSEEAEKVADIDEDWKSSFMDEAKNISDEDMQIIWNKILRGKSQDSGAFSKRTVKIVGQMDKRDAEMFTHFCQFVVNAGPLNTWAMVYDHNSSIYNNKRFRMFHVLEHLGAIGLITVDLSSNYIMQPEQVNLLVNYHGRSAILSSLPKEGSIYKFRIGAARFTEAGLQLFPICGATPNWEFWEYLLAKWNELKYNPVPVQIR